MATRISAIRFALVSDRVQTSCEKLAVAPNGRALMPIVFY